MYDETQIIKVKWNGTNRKWFEEKGYVYTKVNDEFNVSVKDISPYSKYKIRVICDYCGQEYYTQIWVIMSGRKFINKDACSHCAATKANEINWRKRSKKNFDLLYKICKDNDYILLTKESEFTDVKMKIKFICKKHGVQTMILDNFKRGHKCFLCSYEYRFDNIKLNKEFINQVIIRDNNVWLNPNEYTTCVDKNLSIKCSCGNTFTTSFVNYYRHNVNRCKKCSHQESVGELQIKKFLDKNNIEYIREKRFRDCKDKRALPFDFFLPNYNLCIEFDGQQHFKPNFGEQNFNDTQNHDHIKNEYCKNKNIELLRIPYWERQNIESIIRNKLNI